MNWHTSKTADFTKIRDCIPRILKKAKMNPRFTTRLHKQQVTLRFEDYAAITDSLKLKLENVEAAFNSIGVAMRYKIGFEGSNPGVLIHLKAVPTANLKYCNSFTASYEPL